MIITKIKELKKYPLIIITGAFTVMMLVGYSAGSETVFSETENRYLQSIPSVSIETLSDGSFMDKFDTFAEERLPFRNAYIKTKAMCEMMLFKCENNGIIRGAKGQLYEKSLSESNQLSKNIGIISDFLSESDRKVYIAIAPTQSTICRDGLPTGAPVLDEKSAAAKLEAAPGMGNAHIIDIMDAFTGRDCDGFYYKTDHHWTSRGAYQAYLCMAQSMGFDAVDINTLTRNQVDDFYGTSYSKYKGPGIKPDTIEYYDVSIDYYRCDDKEYDGIYDLDKKAVYDKYSLFMYGNPGRGVIKNSNCSNGRSLLVMKDSYANSVLPFLTQSYENIEVIDLRYFSGSVKEELAQNPDSDILFLYNWSFMNSDNHFYKLMK